MAVDRPKHEYRIQITGITPPLELNPAGPTILIGCEPNLGCFAGFDLNKRLAAFAGFRFSPPGDYRL